MRHQRGVAALVAAIFLSLALTALGALDIGHLYNARRQLQRTADLAAMAGVQVISSPSGCASVSTATQQNAASNGFTPDGGTTTLSTTCGRWNGSSSTHFSASGAPLNAVQVKVTENVPYFFVGPSRNVSATATALATNIDAFSLATGIATLNTQQSALLNAILGGLLKTGVALSVGNVQSLASAHVKLGDLMVALGASSMQGLLNTTVSYQTLMVALVQALQAGGDSINAAILQTLAVAVPGGQTITIGDGGTSAPGLLALGTANPDSAASATVNALDALLVSAQIAQRSPDGSQVNAPVINVASGLAGIAGLSLQVIHPPVLAVGEGGATPPTIARASVMNATVNLLPITLPTLTVGGAPLLAVTLSSLNAPLVVTVGAGTGTATLSSVDCESTRAATNATLQVAPGIASVCLAGDAACTRAVNVVSLSAVILGVTVPVGTVGLNPGGVLPLAPGTLTPLVFDGSSGSFDASKSANSNAVGSDGAMLTTALFAAMPGLLQVAPLGTDLSSVLGPILSGVTGLLTAALQPIFSRLDTVLIPTLSLLGVQVGTATVHNMSLTCGVAQLVN
ncbi:TadG family pilus assembly protein [Paraburkholderia sp. PREW-6R]|uniref:TadG family pilus assembly protein n=1 Tax=Paraburkholderia sp. PREW-6R TaxID=3141544 RepID=UPI0031F5366C